MDQVQCNKNYRRCSLERMFVLTVCLSMSWSDRDGAHLIDHVFQNVFYCLIFGVFGRRVNEERFVQKKMGKAWSNC